MTATHKAPGASAESIRLDLWLWCARFHKTRAFAKAAIEHGQVRVDGERAKPARLARPGMRLSIEKEGEVFEIEILALARRRGPASEARLLYSESEESVAAREQVRLQRRAERAGYRAPETRPDKRARRLIRALGDIEAL